MVCEGRRTERVYIETLRQAFRLSSENLVVRVADGGSPLNVVQQAVKLRGQMSRAAREARPDATWAICDVESSLSNASDALRLAHNERVLLALSNPCFEFWLLLHGSADAPPLTSDAAKARCAKRNVPGVANEPARFEDERLGGDWRIAAERAAALRRQVIDDENVHGKPCDVVLARNPGTCVDELVAELCADGERLKSSQRRR